MLFPDEYSVRVADGRSGKTGPRREPLSSSPTPYQDLEQQNRFEWRVRRCESEQTFLWIFIVAVFFVANVKQRGKVATVILRQSHDIRRRLTSFLGLAGLAATSNPV